MLHEILLALAGHPSPLVDDAEQTSLDLSTSEKKLLASIGVLSKLHQTLRERVRLIAGQHKSVICQAVANTIRQVHLQRFSTKIIEVEEGILTKDSALCGAYDIVPLASIVGQFDEWQHRLRYLQEVTDYMVDAGHQNYTAAGLINKLRADARTGFSDLELIANELSRVAEITWLRQLTEWLLHGKISSHSEKDFFVHVQPSNGDHESMQLVHRKLPHFVTDGTAESILFIGQTIRGISRTTLSATIPDHVVADHLRMITELSLPIVQAGLDRTITDMRASISCNVLQHLLPPQLISLAMSSLQQYFLFRDSEFASCLVEEAERQKESQWQNMNRMVGKDPLKAMRGLSLKKSEVQQTLDRTWQRIAAIHDDERYDELIDFARKHITLCAPQKALDRPPTTEAVNNHGKQDSLVSFDDILLPIPASLQMDISAPLHLLINPKDIERASLISSYLLAIQRAHMRLSDLWRRTSSRRRYSRGHRAEVNHLRNIWQTCSAALLFLSELIAYQNSEVLGPSCKHYQTWLAFSHSDDSERPQRDPETLARAFCLHLDAITHALLVTEVRFTKELRSLLGSIDHLIALFSHLLEIEEQDNLIDNVHASSKRHAQVIQTNRACERVNSGLQTALAQLQHLAQDMSRHTLSVSTGKDVFQAFVPGGLDRLLIKLQYSKLINDGEDDDSDGV